MDRIAVNPPRLVFKRSQEKDLLLSLHSIDRMSDVIPAREVLGAGMNSVGEIGGLKMTVWSLYQVCNVVCPGLFKTVRGLATGDTNAELAAIAIFNQALRLRVDRLAEHRFLCNRETKTIDAMVGSRYKFYKNLHFYQRVKDSLPPCRFGGATISGRWLSMRFYHPETVAETADGKYFPGFHMANHEGGQASITVSNILLRFPGQLGFLSQIRYDKVPHVGREVANKFARRMARVLDHQWDSVKLLDQIAQAQAAKLGLGSYREILEKRRRRNICWILQKTGLTKSLAMATLSSAIVQPCGEKTPLPLVSIGNADLRERTAYDLAVAVSRCGQGCHLHVRELAERAAFNILTGNVRFPIRK